MEDRETGLREETGRCSEERDQKLQSNSADIGDVKVVRVMHFLRLEREKNLKRGRMYMLVEGIV